MERGKEKETLDKLVEQKEQEWREIQNLRMHTLAENLEEKEKCLNLEKIRFRKLKEDFEYNLKIIEKRDTELLQFEKFVQDLREREKLRNQDVSDLKIIIDDLRMKLEQAESEKLGLQNHYKDRVAEMQGKMNDFIGKKNEEYSREQEDYVTFKRNAERKIEDAANEMVAQKQQLIFEFDEQGRKRDSEFRIKLDEVNNLVHTKEVHLRMIKRELEACRENAKKRFEEKSNLDDEVIELKKQLKQKEWAVKDIENMAAVNMAEMKQKLNSVEKEYNKQSIELQEKVAEIDKCYKEKCHQFLAYQQASQEKEIELQGSIDSLKNDILEEKNKLRQNIWDFNDRLKQKDLALNNMQLTNTKVETQAKHDLENSTRGLIARDLEIENLKASYNNTLNELDRLKINFQKTQSDLKSTSERERVLEQANAQRELEWQRRYEDVSRDSEEKFQNLVKLLESKLETSVKDCKSMQTELDQRDHLIKVLKRDKDIAFSLLKKNGVEIAAFASNFSELVDKSELDESIEQIEQLKNVIRHMRQEIETIVGRHKNELKLSSLEYAKDLENQVKELKQDKRQLLISVDDLHGKIEKLENRQHNCDFRDKLFSQKVKFDDMPDSNLKAKLKSAFLKIQSLSNDKGQLLKLGNKLRAEVSVLKMQLQEADSQQKSCFESCHDNMPEGNRLRPTGQDNSGNQGSGLSRLGNIENLQYRLTTDQMKKQSTGNQNIKVQMLSSSDASEESSTNHDADNLMDSQQNILDDGEQDFDLKKYGTRKEVLEPNSEFPSRKVEGKIQHTAKAVNVSSSSDLSSLHDLWRLLDETESLVNPTPRTSSRRATDSITQDTQHDVPERDQTVSKQANDVEISGQPVRLVEKAGARQLMLSKKAKGQLIPKKKPTVRNYNSKDD